MLCYCICTSLQSLVACWKVSSAQEYDNDSDNEDDNNNDGGSNTGDDLLTVAVFHSVMHMNRKQYNPQQIPLLLLKIHNDFSCRQVIHLLHMADSGC